MCLTFAFSRYHPYHGWGCVIGIIIFDLIIIATVIMSIRFSGNRLDTKNDYAPGDTRIVSHSSIFCQSLTLRDTSSTAATLYLLREKPQLTGHDNFTNPERYSIAPGDENHLYYYLYPGSQFSVSTCLTKSGTVASFYLIKGTGNFSSWSDDTSSDYALHSFYITSVCSQGKTNYSYSFSSEDQYYFVLYNPSSSSTVRIHATFVFDRVLYQPINGTIADSCQAGGSGQPLWGQPSCKLSVPYLSSYTALIVVDSANTIPEEDIPIHTSCGTRVWVYVMIGVVPTLFLFLCFIGIRILLQRYHQKAYKSLDNPSTTTANLGSGKKYASPPRYGTN